MLAESRRVAAGVLSGLCAGSVLAVAAAGAGTAAFVLGLGGAGAMAIVVGGRRGALLGAFLLYLLAGCVAFLWLRQLPDIGFSAIAVLVAAVWATDIGAYFAGRGLGGAKLAPRISPKKTWAGLIGGMICAGVATGVVSAALPGATLLLDGADGLVFVALGALLGVISQGGDLIESALKRYVDVKDASNLIPGHGGVLDRADGLLSASPALALVIVFIHQGV